MVCLTFFKDHSDNVCVCKGGRDGCGRAWKWEDQVGSDRCCPAENGLDYGVCREAEASRRIQDIFSWSSCWHLLVEDEGGSEFYPETLSEMVGPSAEWRLGEEQV